MIIVPNKIQSKTVTCEGCGFAFAGAEQFVPPKNKSPRKASGAVNNINTVISLRIAPAV